MATEGNNISLGIAQVRDDCLESFEPRFRDVVKGNRLPVDLEEYIQVKNAKNVTENFSFDSASKIMEKVQEVDYMASNGQMDANIAEAIMLELLENIDDVHMIMELER